MFCLCFAGITFTPKEVGEHLVSVKKAGHHITNSPFKIIVGSQDVGDATKVKVRGRGIAEADAGQTADFIVDTRNAGKIKRMWCCSCFYGYPMY